MALTPGTRLGAYEVIAQIGVGGMGEVYRAMDTKLKRHVALKILPASLAGDHDRLARLQREAEVLASLNHPNIAAIHGLEDANGVKALVMELVEGPTLADRLVDGAIPLDEALPIARQIAEALGAAHEQGIIHRDLKPANIKVRPDGTVKVLDFGLAKSMEPEGYSLPSATRSPTITTPAMTQAGMILGTAAYMSPEQAKGKPADKRGDIWAFGCVLYEMLTGKRAFDGEDTVDVLGAVARLDPNWEALSSDLPPSVRTLLHQCLVKDRRRRIGDIAAAQFVPDHETATTATGTLSAAPFALRPLWKRALPIAASLIVGSLLTMLAAAFIRPASVEFPETRLEITTPPGRLSFSKLSPDGRNVVFSAAAVEGKPSQLWLRSFESEVARPLAGTENGAFPFWSPDSRSIGFYASRKLMRLDLAGGSARPLANAPDGIEGAWGPDGTILFTPTATSPLYRVPATGGPPSEVTHLASQAEACHRFPAFLPDGRHFLFYVAGTASVQGVYIGSLDGRDTRRLLESDSAAVFAEPDYVLFRRDENLLAQRVDLKTLETTGDSFSVAERVSGNQGTVGEIAVSASDTGLVAYRAPMSDPRQLTWFDRAGRQLGTLGDLTTDRTGPPRISPDGRTVAVGRTIDGNLDVWLIETARGVRRRFTSDPLIDDRPVWSPDNNGIVFLSRRSGSQDLWRKRIDGGTEERLRESAENESPTDWSPDGRFILFTIQSLVGGGALDLWALPLEGDRKLVAVANASFEESQGRFSPDGDRVVFQSNETGRSEIYVVPFPGPGVPTQVSTNGGVNPQWRQDGREILYLGPDNRLMAVSVMVPANGRLEAGMPTALFTIPQGAAYDVSRDGQRILINTPVGQATTPPITVIQSWKPSA